MASSTNNPIGWCDRTWNPVRGCSRVSPGCDNCYAMGQAHRFSGPGKPFEGLTTLRKGKVDWSGRVRLVPDALDLPLRTRKPTRFFVNSMSDLFHPALKDDEIDRVFGAMWACLYVGRRNPIAGHVFQILTKRADRMRDYFSTERRSQWAQYAGAMCEDGDAVHDQTAFHDGPHPRIWLGVSCEDQQRADERIPHLLQTPAAVRFVSAEPLLGPIDFARCSVVTVNGFDQYWPWFETVIQLRGMPLESPTLDWVIVGGESGPRSRPMAVDWVRAIVSQCKEARVRCFVKQLGARPVEPRTNGRSRFDSFEHWVNKGKTWLDSSNALYDAKDRQCRIGADFARARDEDTFPVRIFDRLELSDRKGGNPEEWPKFLDVRQFPEGH